MNIVNIKFEVHYHDVTHTHGLIGKHENYHFYVDYHPSIDSRKDARYRIYINSDLLAERIWYWGNEHYIEETVFMDLDKNVEHTIKLEPLFARDYLGYPIAILMKNIQIPKASILSQSKNNLTFKLA